MATSCSPQAPAPPQGAAVAPETSTSAPVACRPGRALGLVFAGPEAQGVAVDLRAFVVERGLPAEVLEKPGKVIVIYRGTVDDKVDVVRRARARGIEFTIETLVDVGADCDLHWQLAPGSTPP